jgi:beta-phosphoglucomutase
LWDLDGTLVDSEAQHWESWLLALGPEGVSVTYEQFRQTFGQRNDAILSRWLGPGAEPARIRRIGDTKEVHYRDLVARSGLAPLPGANQWVRDLHREGWRQAVASSAPRANVEVVVNALGLDRYFDTLVAAEDVTRGKPEPEVFLTAATRLSVPPAQCVVVEDSPAGVEAARRAGMPSIGIGAPRFAPADVVVASLANLPHDIFDRLIDAAAQKPSSRAELG